jgi:hypothetical protein
MLAVLGVPPAHAVIDWESATIGGLAAVGVLGEPTIRRITSQAAALWPPGPHALAHAAAEAVAALAGVSRRAISAFVEPVEPGGRRTRAVALPVRLGPAGVRVVERPALSVATQVALDNAMLL